MTSGVALNACQSGSTTASPGPNDGGSPGGSGGSGSALFANGGSAGAAGGSQAAQGTSGSAGAVGAGGMTGSTDSCADHQVDCNGSCLGVEMSGNGCKVLATTGDQNVDIGQGLTLDDQYVYWTEEGTRVAIARASKAAGDRQQVALCDQLPFEISVNSTHVAWTEGGFDTQKVRFVPKAGGTPVDLLTEATTDQWTSAVATESRVYFQKGPFGLQSDIVSVGFANQDVLIHGQSDGYQAQIALTADSVYWSSDGSSGEEIRSANLTGTQRTAALVVPSLITMTLVGDAFYLITGQTSNEVIQRLTLAGQVSDVYRGPEVAGSFLAVSGSTLYFGNARAIYKLEANATTPTLALTSKSNIESIVADSSGLYASVNRMTGTPDAFIVKVE